MIINCNCKTDVGFISVCCCCPIGGHTYILFKLYNCVHLSCGILIPLKGLKYLFESLALISEYSGPLSSYGQHCREETFVSLRVSCFFNIKQVLKVSPIFISTKTTHRIYNLISG